MRTALLLSLALLLAAPLAAQEDPLRSPACGAALARLDAARQGGAAVEASRAQAATACLGSAALPQRPSRVLRPPVRVPPPQIEPSQAAAPPAAPASLPPPVAIQRPPGAAVCDAGGCWSQGGTHLRHVPPPATLPQGPCIPQGNVAFCP